MSYSLVKHLLLNIDQSERTAFYKEKKSFYEQLRGSTSVGWKVQAKKRKSFKPFAQGKKDVNALIAKEILKNIKNKRRGETEKELQHF